MLSPCPITYYKYYLFGSVVKMPKKQQYSGLSAASTCDFVKKTGVVGDIEHRKICFYCKLFIPILYIYIFFKFRS